MAILRGHPSPRTIDRRTGRYNPDVLDQIKRVLAEGVSEATSAKLRATLKLVHDMDIPSEHRNSVITQLRRLAFDHVAFAPALNGAATLIELYYA